MSRIRTIKADGETVDQYEECFKRSGTWTNALQKAIDQQNVILDMITVEHSDAPLAEKYDELITLLGRIS